ncbi:deoxyguanosinetriphosphate triphosphohydrolase [Robertkochia sediminum]|uniref:deoxyguanosinetriphosphate triphosphohydrolase n=1 Tax=Robertkochia sediminum TaxID=2785326 RepID=UPI001933EA2A|nr:deoxyguanosinetriphosphate triphosphohydrolase [Robertkochia sediminum]MBL7471864.1 deoxyguanosinetriphosphate triphosphohydrolase [Robertkochia sediminum]
MNWEDLLSLKRHGDTTKRIRKEQDETRLGFEVDYDRIIFSSAFRSLQDKTQVIPLSKTDFVHTRLTHSLEVSVVGRSLGRAVGRAVLEKHPYLAEVHGYRFNDFGAIVAAAALAHDIGNPPFGHSGEKAIGEFFEQGAGKEYKALLTDKEYQDLVDFEGNANGLSILTETRKGIDGGLRLSYATLGAFMKYPKESLPKRPSEKIADKKYGCFQAEKAVFNEVARELGLIPTGKGDDHSYCRHPLTFLVEAADDICYTIIDFEDGINLGLIGEEYALEYLINLVRDSINTAKYHALSSREDRLAYLRALSISTLINDAVRIFLENEEAILAGEFHVALLERSKFKAQIDDIIKISVSHIYRSQEVVQKEIAGYRILNTLLDIFCGAVMRDYYGKASNYDKLILDMLPERFKEANTPYRKLLSVSQFVAGLTDGNALLIFNKINGQSL